MPYQFPPDVDALVHGYLSSGRYASQDEVLRAALQALTDEDEDLKAIQEGLADLESGDLGIPLDDAFEMIRRGVAERE